MLRGEFVLRFASYLQQRQFFSVVPQALVDADSSPLQTAAGTLPRGHAERSLNDRSRWHCRAWHWRGVNLVRSAYMTPPHLARARAFDPRGTAFAQPVALSLKISTERRIIGLTERFDELRKADTSCAERILARQNDVAEQNLALFRQVSFPSGSRKMDRTTSLAARSAAHFRRVRQIEKSLSDRSAFAHAFAGRPILKSLEKTADQRSANGHA